MNQKPLFLALLALATVMARQAVAAPRVNIDTGIVEGAAAGPGAEDAMFLGMPYAAPPVGVLRWAPPAPAATWQGVRRAQSFGASCPQDGPWPENSKNYHATLPGLGYYAGHHTNEDCLFIDVWTNNLGKQPRLPVVVWIHGGGNSTGTGEEPPLAPAFTSRGVVLVAFNYRLGMLGFMAHPALTAESPHHASGNYALMDQIAALQWVRRNIAAFGGDPENVTLMGSSAGGLNACMMLISPLARGLFRRAIVESNSCGDFVMPELKRVTRYYGGESSGEGFGVRLAKALGIEDGPDVLAKLRSKSADEILKAKPSDAFFDGLVDGYVVPEQPALLFAKGLQAHVPVLLGSNADESAMFFAEAPKTVTEYRKMLEADLAGDWKTIFDLYPAASDAVVRDVWASMHTDFYFGTSVYQLARDMQRAGQPAYLYRVTYKAPAGPYQGYAHHGIELMFLTQMFGGEPEPDAARLSSAMLGYWIQFAKTGDPNAPGLANWPAFDPKRNELLELGHQVRVIGIPHLAEGQAFATILQKRLGQL